MSVEISWAGGPTFAVGYRGIRFYLEPGRSCAERTDADMVTVSGLESLDPEPLQALLAASPRAKAIFPKAIGERAHALGIPYQRMTTTDAALRVEYFKNGEYGRVYGVPAARRGADGQPELDWTPIGGFPRIGFMARFGTTTVWHSGCGLPYPELAARLKPYSVSVAIVAIGAAYFTEVEAADLAEAMDANWLVAAPMDEGAADRFVGHMLGHRPAVRFKVFGPEERWIVPGSEG
jgi:hypothetical protein